MAKKASKETKLSRCFKAPIRFLIKARELYIQSMSDCSGRVDYGSFMGFPTPQGISTLPKSFSTTANSSKSSDGEDLRELIRAASTRSLGNKVQLELLRPQQSRKSPMTGLNVMRRSQSAAIGRIDEEEPCEFAEDIKVKSTDIYPRSRSYAVSKKANMF